MNRIRLALCATFALLCLIPLAAASQQAPPIPRPDFAGQVPCKVLRVIDGDTIDVLLAEADCCAHLMSFSRLCFGGGDNPPAAFTPPRPSDRRLTWGGDAPGGLQRAGPPPRFRPTSARTRAQ